MISNFGQFLIESKYSDAEREKGSIGRWLEERIVGDPYLRHVTAPFLSEIDPTIRLANAIDMLSDFDKRQVFNAVVRHRDGRKTNESAEPQTPTGGKNVFKSFLKCITSLGLSNLNKLAKPGFLIYFETHECAEDLVMQSVARFRSLSSMYAAAKVGNVKLFYAIDSNLIFSYGISHSAGQFTLGAYTLNKSAFVWLQALSSPSSAQIRAELYKTGWESIVLFKKLMRFMQEYPLGEKGKSTSVLDAGTLCFSYHGVSKWDNGVMDQGEYSNIKSNLKTRLSSTPWHDRVLVRVSADNFSLHICFRVK